MSQPKHKRRAVRTFRTKNMNHAGCRMPVVCISTYVLIIQAGRERAATRENAIDNNRGGSSLHHPLNWTLEKRERRSA
eukprot:scaffold6383_cov202-Skeletonema_dohrnii-CCMP3373.AAC.3